MALAGRAAPWGSGEKPQEKKVDRSSIEISLASRCKALLWHCPRIQTQALTCRPIHVGSAAVILFFWADSTCQRPLLDRGSRYEVTALGRDET